MKNEKLQLVRIAKKAKSENRAAFRLHFISCERCLLCYGIGREGTLFLPFLLFLLSVFSSSLGEQAVILARFLRRFAVENHDAVF